MNKILDLVKRLPYFLLRFAHLIKHFFCELDECEDDFDAY